MKKIRKGDEIIVIAGRDRGKRGNVLKILNKERILVDGINLVKKHVRPNPNKGDTGGIVERESAIHISNCAIFNPTTNKADRVGIELTDDKKKSRVFKSSGEPVDV